MIPRRKPRFYKRQTRDIIHFIFSAKAVQGQYVELFEKKAAEYIGTKFAIATNSGRGALELLLEAYGLKEGDEIIVPAYTLKDLIELMKRKGFVPKIVDIEKDSFNMDPECIESQIGPRTKVILATHILGLPCNLEEITHIAEKYRLKVIEDCAHAIGGKYKGKKLGSWTDAAIFSLEFSKNINTFGGGLVTTNDEKVATFIREKIHKLPFSKKALIKKILFCYLEYYLTISPFFNLVLFPFCFRRTASFIKKIYVGLSSMTRMSAYRYTNLQALMGLKQLERLDEMNTYRKNIAFQLNSLFKNNSLVKLQTSNAESGRIYYHYLIRLHRGYDLYKFRRQLFFKGVDCGIFSEITDNCGLILNKDCPNTEEVYKTVVQLPLLDNMTVPQIEKIAVSVQLMCEAANKAV